MTKTKRSKNSFILYYEYEEHFQELTDEQVGRLVRALFRYDQDGELPKLKGACKMAFSFIKADLDANRTKYDDKCAKNRANAQKRWQKCDGKNGNAKDADNDSEHDRDHERDQEHEQEQEQEQEHEQAALTAQIAAFSADPQLQAALAEYVHWRALIGRPVTEFIIRSLLEDLRKLGQNDQERLALVERSLTRGWVGFYPPDQEGEPGQAGPGRKAGKAGKGGKGGKAGKAVPPGQEAQGEYGSAYQRFLDNTPGSERGG